MAKKIILFLSEYRKSVEKEYLCPDGGTVKGAQTSDAPVRYLLRKHPDIGEILCIVTDEAKKGEPNAWDAFRAFVADAAAEDERAGLRKRAAECREIPFREGQDFQTHVLPAILREAASGDEILLETTGGIRNTVMYLLLISRALSYAGVRTIDAVYSNFKEARITDALPVIDLFDLVGGMQEMASFGNVRALKAYYKKHTPDAQAKRLIDAMDGLWENIALCRPQRVTEKLEAFNAALAGAEQCEDALMRALLPAFEKKFDRKLTVPGLIKWCVESGMYQQAVTLYTEMIPRYLVERGDFLRSTGETAVPEGQNFRDPVAYRFYNMVRDLAEKDRLNRLESTLTVREVAERQKFGLLVSGDRLMDAGRDYLYIKLLRNLMNHANDEPEKNSRELSEYLVQICRFKRPESVGAADIENALQRALDHLRPPAGKRR